MSKNAYKYTQGVVAPGYETVRAMFEQQFQDEVNEYAQLCVIVKGVTVVDLYGSRPKKQDTDSDLSLKYDNSSVQNIFSSTKVLTSLVVAMLVDRGRLKYDQKVVDIWPEYGQNNKETTTIAEIMRHEAGIPSFDTSIPATKLYTEAIKTNSISNIIARQKPKEKPGTKFQYHALTRGWIVNEIVRRVDEERRTIGQFLREEIAIPLNLEKELYIGIPLTEHHRIAPLNTELQKDYVFNLKNLALPRFLGGGRVPINSFGLRLMFLLGLSVYSIGFSLQNIASALQYIGFNAVGSRNSDKEDGDGDSIEDKAEAKHDRHRSGQGIHIVSDKKMSSNVDNVFNHAQVRMGETPSANGHASARALAKVAATIVGGGQLDSDSYRLLSKNGCREALRGLRERVVIQFRGFQIFRTNFCNAGWNFFKDTRCNYIGWMGYGGSVCQWHAGEQIGIGFTVNLLELSVLNARAQELQYEVLNCVKRLKKHSGSVANISKL